MHFVFDIKEWFGEINFNFFVLQIFVFFAFFRLFCGCWWTLKLNLQNKSNKSARKTQISAQIFHDIYTDIRILDEMQIFDFLFKKSNIRRVSI